MNDAAFNSIRSSANRGGLSKYELQLLAETYPELEPVFNLLDEVQDHLEDIGDSMADEYENAEKMARNIDIELGELSNNLDSIDWAVTDETDVNIEDFNEHMKDARATAERILHLSEQI